MKYETEEMGSDWTASRRRATPEEKDANNRALKRLFKLFPRLPKRNVGDFLMSNTAFPFVSLIYAIDRQCTDLSRIAHKDVTRAYIESNRSMERAMRHYHEKHPEVRDGAGHCASRANKTS